MSTKNYFTQAPVSKGHYDAMCAIAAINTFNAATRVLDRDPEATYEDGIIASDNGLITYEIDVDGVYPSPTWLYIVLQESILGTFGDPREGCSDDD